MIERPSYTQRQLYYNDSLFSHGGFTSWADLVIVRKFLKACRCQPRLLYTVTLSFRVDGEKTFP